MTARPVRIGCSGWQYKSWRETFYPPRLPARRWLEHYATQFDTVEVNSTFYRLAKPAAVDGWVHHTPYEFVFALKASQYLTHMKRLTDMDRGVGRYYESIAPLAESPKLGPVLWQLPDSFRRDDDRLAHALANLPPGRHAFELRHPSWFAEPVYALLREHGAAFVLHDDRRRQPTPGGPDHGLDLPALPLRPPRAPRQLLRDGAARVGGAGPRAGRSRPRSSPTSTTTGRSSRPATPSGCGSSSKGLSAREPLVGCETRRGVEQPGSSSGS